MQIFFRFNPVIDRHHCLVQNSKLSTNHFAKLWPSNFENLFFELLESSEPPVLLHGDLHHDNVLSTIEGEYLAIDPKGVLGERCYEVGAFLRNPSLDLLKKEKLGKIMRRRVDMIVERLGFERERVIGWGISQAVLSAIWCDEDGVDCMEGMMRVAEILESIQ